MCRDVVGKNCAEFERSVDWVCAALVRWRGCECVCVRLNTERRFSSFSSFIWLSVLLCPFRLSFSIFGYVPCAVPNAVWLLCRSRTGDCRITSLAYIFIICRLTRASLASLLLCRYVVQNNSFSIDGSHNHGAYGVHAASRPLISRPTTDNGVPPAKCGRKKNRNITQAQSPTSPTPSLTTKQSCWWWWYVRHSCFSALFLDAAQLNTRNNIIQD